METATGTTAPKTENDLCAGMSSPPQKEHEWLQRLVGDWTFESSCVDESGSATQKFHGSEKVKSIGGFWIIGEGEGDSPGGGTAKMMITLGFDPKQNRFVGTWLGSMMAYLWHYEGQLDESGRILTLSADGPSFTDPAKLAKYEDVIEMVSDEHRILTSRTLGDDGKWTQFMTAHYRRTK